MSAEQAALNFSRISARSDEGASTAIGPERQRVRGRGTKPQGHLSDLSIGIETQFPNGIVSSVSFVSTTNTARSLAGFVLLALALTPWRSPGSSEKLCPAL